MTARCRPARSNSSEAAASSYTALERADFGMFRVLPRCIDAPCMHLIAHMQVFVRRVLGVDSL